MVAAQEPKTEYHRQVMAAAWTVAVVPSGCDRAKAASPASLASVPRLASLPGARPRLPVRSGGSLPGLR